MMDTARAERAYNFRKIGGLQYARHFIQLIAFIFLNGKLFGLQSTNLIVPYLHTTEAPYSTVHGAYESLEYTIAQGLFPILVLGIIYLTAVTVGRILCGWACPLGMVQDFLSYLPFKKQRITANIASQLRDIKWAVVSFSLLTSILVGYGRIKGTITENSVGAFTDSPFSVISPSGTLFAYIPWMVLWQSNVLATAGMVGWFKFAVFFAVMVPSLYIPRFFCRYVCPMGALLEPISQFKLLRIHRSSKLSKEEYNKVFNDVCPMGVTLQSEESEFIDHPSCVHCGKCLTESPVNLSQTFGL